jgi:putative ABC transport system permease protein
VRDAIAANVPNVEVLTSHEFAVRTIKYWMLETGAGITVVLTAVLGLIVGAFIISQTLYTTTQENLGHYTTLVALGFGFSQLVGIVLLQSTVLGLGGIGLGSLGFFAASHLSASTPIPVETTDAVFAGLVAVSLAGCLLASLASIRSIFKVDPVAVFRV